MSTVTSSSWRMGDVAVTRARLEEVQPLARRYDGDADVEGVRQPAMPAQGIYWIARRDGEAVGYAAGTLRPEGLVLGPIYVLPEARRGGVASRLLQEVERWADGTRVPLVEVSVVTENVAGLRFLESAGYRVRRLLLAHQDERPPSP